MKTLKLGDLAPNFDADTTEGRINFYDYLGDHWGVLFSHTKDFTPVCTTELATVAKSKKDFEKRNVKVLSLSTDDIETHKKWLEDISENQHTKLNFPLIADSNRKIAYLYDMIHPSTDDKTTARSVYVIAPDKKIKLMISYPASTGRNFDEIFRVIDSLQLTQNYKVVTPANWKKGEEVVIDPNVSDEEAKKMFPKGFKKVQPYMRVTPPPK